MKGKNSKIIALVLIAIGFSLLGYYYATQIFGVNETFDNTKPTIAILSPHAKALPYFTGLYKNEGTELAFIVFDESFQSLMPEDVQERVNFIKLDTSTELSVPLPMKTSLPHGRDEPVSYDFNFVLALPTMSTGSHTIIVSVTDIAQNEQSSSQTFTTWEGSVTGTVVITDSAGQMIPDDGYCGGVITITLAVATGVDQIDSAKLKISGGMLVNPKLIDMIKNGDSYSQSVNTVEYADGTYTIEVVLSTPMAPQTEYTFSAFVVEAANGNVDAVDNSLGFIIIGAGAVIAGVVIFIFMGMRKQRPELYSNTYY